MEYRYNTYRIYAKQYNKTQNSIVMYEKTL